MKASYRNGMLTLVLGVLLGIVVTQLLSTTSDSERVATTAKPLYWVAPMDPNYRRDQPGKSPMGMDLVPVYANDQSAAESPGTVRISPEVVNNLGVRTAKAERGLLDVQINTVGYVQYDQDSLVHMHPRVEGWVETLYVKAAGDPVAAGQPIYDLYSPQLVNAQEELLLALNRNTPRLVAAAEERLRALQIDQATIDTLKRTRKVRQTMTFYAPQSGVVDNLNIREGFFVKPGTTLMSIGNLANVWVEAEVFERQAALVVKGLPVSMTLDYLPGRQWEGEVDYVYPTLNDKTRTAGVRVSVANPDRLLKPNMFAQIHIDISNTQEALVVPREAVIRTGQQNRVVLALGDGQFKSIAVDLGRVGERFVEVLRGLQDGESVVTSAQFLLDSESSKTSDFKRWHSSHEPAEHVWTGAEIISVMPSHRMITARHEPIENWGWPAMTMDFHVAGSVDMASISVGEKPYLLITHQDDRYQIADIYRDNEWAFSALDSRQIESWPTQTATADGVIKQIDVDTRLVAISRGPIAKWNRPAATVDFTLDPVLDITTLNTGARIAFRFVVAADGFRVVALSLPSIEDSKP